MTFDLAFLAVRLGIVVWLLARLKPVPPASRAARRPACSVVVPARDEAGQLPKTLPAVLDQLQPDDELVVVDDHSADGTADTARALGAQVVPSPPVPRGWTGKAWACWTGAEATTKPVIVFLDADTALAPGTLDAVVANVAGVGGVTSIQPYHRVPTAVEKLSAFFNVVALMATDAFTPLGRRQPASAAFGPVLAFTRADYVRLDGHRAVRDEVIEDIALGQRWRADGQPVTCFAGRGTASFRMYPGGWRQLVDGWTKNLAAGAAAVRLPTTLLTVLWVSLPLQATWDLARLALGRPWGGAGWTLGLYAVVVAQLWWVLRRIGSFGLATALLFPIPLLFFLAVFIRSAIRTAGGAPVRWKGRDVPTRPGTIGHGSGRS